MKYSQNRGVWMSQEVIALEMKDMYTKVKLGEFSGIKG